jgi:hypothetical protein
MVAKRHNPVTIAMAKPLEKKGFAPKATVGASMQKLVHLIYVVISHDSLPKPTYRWPGLKYKKVSRI